MAAWEFERRLDYIDYRMVTAGMVCRADLVRTFGVGMAQASRDINLFIGRYPAELVYNKRLKRYQPRPGYKTLRGHTQCVVHYLKALCDANHPLGWR